MLDFGKYSFEIIISYSVTFLFLSILVLLAYLDSKKVKKSLDKLENDKLNIQKKN